MTVSFTSSVAVLRRGVDMVYHVIARTVLVWRGCLNVDVHTMTQHVPRVKQSMDVEVDSLT